MPLRLLFPSFIGLLKAIAIATACFSVAYAQMVSGQRASPGATGQAPAGEVSAQMEDELWGAIRDSDQARVFEEYVKQYPNGCNVAQAVSRLAGFQKTQRPSATGVSGAARGSAVSSDPETALWKVVLQSDTAGGYEVFLKYYPKSKYALLATSRLKIAREDAKWKADVAEQGAWEAAETAQTPDGYAAYLASYPHGRHATPAQVRGDKLRADAAVAEESRLWQAAEKGGISQVDAYLASYPQGRHASAARSWRVQLKKEEADMIPGKVVKDCPDCPDMVVIPAGGFQMGENDAKPVHTVTIGRPFAMAKTEVTQSQWRTVMGTNPSKFARCDDCPVEGISWNDAQRYVEKLSRMTSKIYRLPSEAEWEYACRAGGRQEYCGSDTVDTVAWHGAVLGSGNSDGKTHPVGQKQSNAFGLHDMSGNVSEWVQDCYHEHYSGGPVDGRAWTTGEGGRAKIAGEQDSAKGIEECKSRVLRGGSWLSWPQNARSAHRLSLPPDSSGSSFGFRPVWSLR